jgi:hypothetical protein
MTLYHFAFTGLKIYKLRLETSLKSQASVAEMVTSRHFSQSDA